MHESFLMQKAILVVVLGIAAQWIAWRLKLPAIVLLAFAGIVAGPVLNWLDPIADFGELVPVIIKLAVAVILFEGGLNLHIFELKKATRAVRNIIVFGIPLAFVLGVIASHFIAGLSLPVACVLAAILVVTGPTVIMPMIRQTRLSARMSSLLKWEGIVNDPIGALLAVIVFEVFITSGDGTATFGVLLDLIPAILVAGILGTGCGFLMKVLFQNALVPEFLKIPFILSFVMFVYGAANIIQEEAGLLAVTIFGFVVGNIGLNIIYELRRFKEYITVFLVSGVFIVLTATLDLDQIMNIRPELLWFFAAVLFLVRPISIWLSTIGSGLNWRERALLSWIAPRGVVAASMAGLFAPAMIEAGYQDAEQLVPIIFGVVLITVILHGFSLKWVAGALGLAHNKKEGVVICGANPWTTEMAGLLKDLDVPVLLVDHSWHRLKDARLKGVPVFYGEILSDYSEATLDFSEMGYLLAASDNDAYNALVCSAFGSHFGRERVFQLSIHARNQEQDRALRSANRGRIAFGKDLHYEKLLSQYYQGWRFQKTTITKEFKFENFLERYQDSAEPLVLIQKKGQLVFDTLRKEAKPQPGDTLISYVAPETT